MLVHSLLLDFPLWQPHFSFPAGAKAHELIALRWLHITFGIIWIGLLYFFNLVLTPAMKQCDPKLRFRIYPELMPRAMSWFRWSGWWRTCLSTRCNCPPRESWIALGCARLV